jgi:hypothetical protein
MKCLSCSEEISEAFFAERSRSEEFKGGRFACLHCGAEHIRRWIGQLSSGEPLHTFRLWGHLASVRHKPTSGGMEGMERRGIPRLKRRR